jgi:hypothetical protein
VAKPEHAAALIKSRIVGHGDVKPDDLLANPLNFRRHPGTQMDALRGSMKELGWLKTIIVNKTTGHVLDGHARVEEAMRQGLPTIPATIVELTPEEERLALAVLDPITELATRDQAILDQLLADVETQDAGIQALLDELAGKEPDGGAGPDKGAASATLAERFGVPPFSILDSRQGYWQDRKRAWMTFGIKSEVGRGENLLKSDTLLQPDKTKREAAKAKAMEYAGGSSPRHGAAPATVTGRLTYVAGNRAIEDLDPVSAKILESGSGTSIFDPVLCELAYRWFCPPSGLVLDPFAGGSVRGVVAGLLGRRYMGLDLRQEQVDANRHQANEIFHGKGFPKPEWICTDSLLMDQVLPDDFQADMILSCPPYADLEVYSDDPADISNKEYPEFLRLYNDIIQKAVARLKPNAFIVWVVGDVRDKKGNYRSFVPHTIGMFEQAGAAFYNEGILVNAVGSAAIRAGRSFESSRKLCKVHQNVLVFIKGDAKKATEAVGPVEFGALPEEPQTPEE